MSFKNHKYTQLLYQQSLHLLIKIQTNKMHMGNQYNFIYMHDQWTVQNNYIGFNYFKSTSYILSWETSFPTK